MIERSTIFLYNNIMRHTALKLITHTHTIDFLRLALAGGMAGAGFWATVYPVDVVKSRIQVTYHELGFITCSAHVPLGLHNLSQATSLTTCIMTIVPLCIHKHLSNIYV